ncbi:MAG: hypothetical protein V4731_06270 [Pseudomonadota bacterium]
MRRYKIECFRAIKGLITFNTPATGAPFAAGQVHDLDSDELLTRVAPITRAGLAHEAGTNAVVALGMGAMRLKSRNAKPHTGVHRSVTDSPSDRRV